MSDTPRSIDGWKYNHPIAELSRGELLAHVDVAQPQLGLHHLRFRSQPLSGALLAMSPGGARTWPASLSDGYVRGDDLVGSYAPSAAWPYAPQIYWRAEQVKPKANAIASVSLLVSIQTNLLDTHPLVSAASNLSAEEVLSIAIGDQPPQFESLASGTRSIHSDEHAQGLLWRLPGANFSYVEFASASDFQQLTIEFDSDNVCTARWQLFADFLEKGVIRRAQIHSAFLPRRNDVALATEIARNLTALPLPLTT
jgi:hypothetical protein